MSEKLQARFCKFWGIEYVDIIDPKQVGPIDSITFAMLTASGYYEQLEYKCYDEQFAYVFYKCVVEPTLTMLDINGITFDTVSVIRDEFQFHMTMKIEIGDQSTTVQIRRQELEDKKVPEYLSKNIAYQLGNQHREKVSKSAYAAMTSEQRKYFDKVMAQRGFFSDDFEFYLDPSFEYFKVNGLLEVQGNFIAPSEKMIDIWRYNQD